LLVESAAGASNQTPAAGIKNPAKGAGGVEAVRKRDQYDGLLYAPR
jgi:hypothetical protein